MNLQSIPAQTISYYTYYIEKFSLSTLKKGFVRKPKRINQCSEGILV